MALLRDPVTREEILAAQRAQQFSPIRSLIAPEAGYTYGDIVPLRSSEEQRVIGRTRSGQPIRGRQIQPAVPTMLREGAESLVNLAEGTQTGMVNPEDVLNVMPMGAAASLLDEGIEGGFTAGMFIGRGNPRANPRAFEVADEMVAAGRRPEDIFRETYRETGDPVFVGRDSQLRQEVSDLGEVNAAPLAQAAQSAFDTQAVKPTSIKLSDITSPEYAAMFSGADRGSYVGDGLPKIYVQSYEEGLESSASASYNPVANYISLNPVRKDPISGDVRPSTEDELRSALIHELQHKVQGSDMLSTGSNTSISKERFDDAVRLYDSKAIDEIVERDRQIKSAMPRFSDVSRADTAKYYDELSRRDNVGQVARKIFSSAEWYRVGDSIVNELGPVPKRSGESRNEWLRQAAARLADVFERQVTDKSLLDMDRKQLKSQYQKMYRRAFPKDSFEVSTAVKDARRYIDNLREDTSPYTLYRRTLGETEARATQTRENMTLEQRANVFPERSYDESPDRMIIDTELFQDTPQGLLNLTRQTR